MAEKYISENLHGMPALTNGAVRIPQNDVKWQNKKRIIL